MKIKTVKIKGDYVDFRREWSSDGNNLTAEVGGSSPRGGITKTMIKLDFDCLQYIMPRLKRAWQQEREIRTNAIDGIDKALGL